MEHVPSKKVEDCSGIFFLEHLKFSNIPADIPKYKWLSWGQVGGCAHGMGSELAHGGDLPGDPRQGAEPLGRD
eukprot:5022994-Pleurochrysis_carterae.AAC.1